MDRHEDPAPDAGPTQAGRSGPRRHPAAALQHPHRTSIGSGGQRGDIEYGDSALFKPLGCVPKSERKSGLRRMATLKKAA